MVDETLLEYELRLYKTKPLDLRYVRGGGTADLVCQPLFLHAKHLPGRNDVLYFAELSPLGREGPYAVFDIVHELPGGIPTEEVSTVVTSPVVCAYSLLDREKDKKRK